MGYIVIFKRLAGIPNVALLVRPIVHTVLRPLAMVEKAIQPAPIVQRPSRLGILSLI